MSNTAVVFYIIDFILLAIGLTFKILTKRRMGGKKKEEKKFDLNDFRLLKNPDTICFECPHFFIYSEKKKKVRYYCKNYLMDLGGCPNASVDDELEHSFTGYDEATEEVKENE